MISLRDLISLKSFIKWKKVNRLVIKDENQAYKSWNMNLTLLFTFEKVGCFQYLIRR